MAEQISAHYLYFGDTARLPYGTKSADTVARYAISAARFLEAQNIDLLVIACNTATALALPQITHGRRFRWSGGHRAQMAAEVSQSGSAIVIATEATVSSTLTAMLCSAWTSGLREGLPIVRPLVEEGWIDHAVTEQVAESTSVRPWLPRQIRLMCWYWRAPTTR